MEKILILGKEGQLARALASLAPEKADVVCAGRQIADLAERGRVSALIGQLRPDIVINAAAYTAVDEAEIETETAFAINALGAEESATAAWKVKARHILVSTDFVFGGAPDQAPFDESAEPAPINVYGRTKLEGERRASAAHPKSAIVRTSAVFSGLGDDFPSKVWRRAASQDTLEVVNDQLTRPTHVDDLASRILALSRVGDATGIFHATGASDASWADFAAAAICVSRERGGPDAHIIPVSSARFPTRALRPTDSRLTGDRLQTATGSTGRDWQERLVQAFTLWKATAYPAA